MPQLLSRAALTVVPVTRGPFLPSAAGKAEPSVADGAQSGRLDGVWRGCLQYAAYCID
eukprot:SAG31_NODE_37980_length_300_cov_0.641791_1_plen_57_part_10